MDRNTNFLVGAVQLIKVALRKESVDRNHAADISARREARSLSARRAWIEIKRNGRARRPGQSLSARRAWIEIVKLFWQNYECFGRSPQGERG